MSKDQDFKQAMENFDRSLDEIKKSEFAYIQDHTIFQIDLDDRAISPLNKEISRVRMRREADGIDFDFSSVAPAGTRFRTTTAVTGRRFSKYDMHSSTPTAWVTQSEGYPEVTFNPKIFELRVAGLVLLHEFGHVLGEGGFSQEALDAKQYLLRLKDLPKGDWDEEKILRSMELWQNVENVAWNHAFDVHNNLKKIGINVAPRIDEGEEFTYPQLWYDNNHNESMSEIFGSVGKKFIWERKV